MLRWRVGMSLNSLLKMSADGGNAGNAMTQHIKWACKYHRGRGVHVTPTVHVNGLEAGIVSSGAAAGLEPTRVCARSPLAVCSRR